MKIFFMWKIRQEVLKMEFWGNKLVRERLTPQRNCVKILKGGEQDAPKTKI